LPKHRLEASKGGICFLKLLQVPPKTQELHQAVTPTCWEEEETSQSLLDPS